MKKSYPVFIIISVLWAGLSLASSSSIFFKGGVITLDQPQIEISKIYGIKMTPIDRTVTISSKEVYIHHLVENLSNSTNIINIEIVSFSQAKGWSAQLVKDETGAQLPKKHELGESAVLSFFLKLTRPAQAQSGNTGYALFKVSSVHKDGDGYLGYNGVSYGGSDEARSLDTVIVK